MQGERVRDTARFVAALGLLVAVSVLALPVRETKPDAVRPKPGRFAPTRIDLRASPSAPTPEPERLLDPWEPLPPERPAIELVEGPLEDIVRTHARWRSLRPTPLHVPAAGSHPRTVERYVELWTGTQATIAFRPWPSNGTETPVASVGIPSHALAPIVRVQFELPNLPPGDYDMRIDGRPVVVDRQAGYECFVPCDLPRDEAIRVVEHSSGCFFTSDRLQVYWPGPEEYEAENGARISRAELEDLRARLLATRPEPGQGILAIRAQPEAYLASLGFDDATLRAHVSELASWIAEGWEDPEGNLPAGLLDSPLFGLPNLRQELVDYLLARSPVGGTDSYMIAIDLPGNPWIHLGTSSSAPDRVPWFAVVGDRSWYVLDRELSCALLALRSRSTDERLEEVYCPAPGVPVPLAEHPEWRAEIWASPYAWSHLATRVRRALARQAYRRLPGWAEIVAAFDPHEPDRYDAGPPRGLPPLTLVPRQPRSLGITTHPGTLGQDWFDVLEQSERAEAAAELQPWIADRKGTSGVQVTLVVPGFAYMDSDDADFARLLEELCLAHRTFFELTFAVDDAGSKNPFRVGTGVLFEDGTLVLLHTRGNLLVPLAERASFHQTGRYVLVRPGQDPEFRSIELSPEHR